MKDSTTDNDRNYHQTSAMLSLFLTSPVCQVAEEFVCGT